jgi:CubicO group peptidase (beta-lactamase class C family)
MYSGSVPSLVRPLVLLVAGVLFSAISIRAQVLSEAPPEQVGMSRERLQRIERVVQEYVDRQHIAGAVALVVRNGKIVYYKGIGYDDLETRTPLKRDAISGLPPRPKP